MSSTKGARIKVLIVLALIASIVYVIVRCILLEFVEYLPVDKVFSILLMMGEFFVILHAVGYGLNMLRVYSNEREEEAQDRRAETPLAEEPAVAILVAARHEPRDVLETTFTYLNNLKYRNKKVYFLDDSSDEKYLKEAEEIAAEYGLELFRRKERHGAKAGIVNDCLKTLDQKYVAIFDADQTPLPEFLNGPVALLESDDKLAFVQTPQFYTNIEESPVARGAAFQQAVFYEYICEGKNFVNAVFCCGTNIIFRREALLSVGGMDETTVTEDFATSIDLHARGWRSLYYNHVNAFGMGPENLASYFMQQYRWANGTVAVFKKILWKFLTRPFSLKIGQWWEYFLSGTYYMVGLAFFFLMICPIAYLFFEVPSFFARPEIYYLAFLPYIVLSTCVFYSVLGERGYPKRDLFLGQRLSIVTFSVYIRAAVTSLLGFRTSFGITEKTKGKAIPYIRLWPQLSVVALSYTAVIWGLNRFIYDWDIAIIVNTIWALWQCWLLSSVFYFNRGEE